MPIGIDIKNYGIAPSFTREIPLHLYWSGFQLSVVKPNPNHNFANHNRRDNTMSQSDLEFEEITSNRSKARENNCNKSRVKKGA